MKPHHDFTSHDNGYSLGTDETSGRRYAAFPVKNKSGRYEEFYALTDAQYSDFLADPDQALAFVEECRCWEHDDLLVVRPGRDRGSAV